MKVTLISYTPEPDKVACLSAQMCYSQIPQTKPNYKVLCSVLKSGHTSVLEHVNFTFQIEGVSRVLSHQLIRHRHIAISQRSGRYTLSKPDEMIVPRDITEPEQIEIFNKAVEQSFKAYDDLIKMGVKPESARYLLPFGMSTNFMFSANARELRFILGLRLCTRTQAEFRELAQMMLDEVRSVAPILFDEVGASCDMTGVCPEGERSCGKHPTMGDYITCWNER